jgi:hypothetical protein
MWGVGGAAPLLAQGVRPKTPHGTKQLVPCGATWLLMILEVEPELRRVCPRRDEVRSTERGQEVVKGSFVCQVDGGQAQAPLEAVTVEQVVVPHTQIKQVARFYARGIVIGVVGAIGCKIQQR